MSGRIDPSEPPHPLVDRRVIEEMPQTHTLMAGPGTALGSVKRAPVGAAFRRIRTNEYQPTWRLRSTGVSGSVLDTASRWRASPS